MRKLGPKGARKRAEILTISREELLRHGPANLVLRDIASKADMTLGNLQYYFPTVDDLLIELARSEWKKMWDMTLARIFEGDPPPEEALERMVLLLRQDGFVASREIVWHLISPRALHNPRFMAFKVEMYEESYTLIASLLKQIQPGRPPKHYSRLTRLIVALIDGSVQQIYSKSKTNYDYRPPRDVLVDICALVLRLAYADGGLLPSLDVRKSKKKTGLKASKQLAGASN